MFEETETVVSPSPEGTTVTTTATVELPVSRTTFDRIPVDITFSHSRCDPWSRTFQKGKRARILLGLWDDHGPFSPVDGGVPDEIVTAGQEAQVAYWYAMRTSSLNEIADQFNVSKSTVSIYASNARWTVC